MAGMGMSLVVRDPTRCREAGTAYVQRVASGSGLPRGSSGSEPGPGGPGGAGGGDVAAAQAGGASDEGGAEHAGATPREVLETPAAARVQVSAVLRGRLRCWARVGLTRRRDLSCVEPGAESGVTSPAPRVPRPDSAPASVPVPPVSLPRVRAVRSAAAAPFLPVWLGRAGHLASLWGQDPGKGRPDPRVDPDLKRRRPPGPGGAAA